MAQSQDSRDAARVDSKTRSKALCGHVDYGGVLCDGLLARIYTGYYRVGGMAGWGRVLGFGQGWVQDARGVWRVSENARRRRARGHEAKYRKTPHPNPADEGGAVPIHVFHTYPVFAACPLCDRVRRLEAATLDVVDFGEVPDGTPFRFDWAFWVQPGRPW